MSEQLDVLILIGGQLRHRYFALQLLRAFPQSRVVVEGDDDAPAPAADAAPTPLVAEHFRDFKKTERSLFGDDVRDGGDLRERTVRRVSRGAINDADSVECIRSLDPRLVAVHGTSLLKPPLVDAFPRRMINLHAGLSPYYRGSGTNVWPFYNRELEYVGMTVHEIDAGIDTGDILLHGRPDIDANDDTHTIGCKNVRLGASLVQRVVERRLADGPFAGVCQDSKRGRMYRKAQFTDDVVRSIRDFIAGGGVREYARAPRAVELVTW